jgi:DNA-binding MurR/RpiR family transcriptional regulator
MAASVANATDTFAVRVAERVEQLAPAERRVAEQLLEFGPEAAALSAAALADQLGTSDATVVRTAKALGYDGLADMRRALATQTENPPLRERLRRTLEQAPREELFVTAIDNHLTAVDALIRNVSPEAFQNAVELLVGCERVVWRGVGPSAHLAAYGQLLAERIGKPSRALTHSGTSFADELLSLTATDALVVLAYGRLQAHVRVLLEHAASLDVPVVLITDSLGRRLATAVDVTLECGRGAPGLFASHGTTLVVIESLILGIAAADPTASQASLTELNDLRAELAGRRIDVDTP